MHAPSPRLLLIDGLPGTGKSTVAHLLCLHLRQHGRDARWFWELESPHPIFDFQDAIVDGALRPGFTEEALLRWQRLADEIAAQDRVTILDASFLQSAVQPMFALNWEASRIASYLRDVARVVAPARPLVALLRYDDVGRALSRLSELRGGWLETYVEPMIRQTPYAIAHDLEGVSGAVAYLRAYQTLTESLVTSLPIPSLVLTASPDVHASAAAIAAAAGWPTVEPSPTTVDDHSRFVGVYCATGAEAHCEIVSDGEHLYVAGAPNARLLQLGDRRFQVAGTCIEYQFEAGRGARMDVLHCRGSFPHLLPTWVRAE